MKDTAKLAPQVLMVTPFEFTLEPTALIRHTYRFTVTFEDGSTLVCTGHGPSRQRASAQACRHRERIIEHGKNSLVWGD